MIVLIYRTVLMFVIIVAAMRLMGKRQMGELELNELVVAVMLSELAVVPLTDTSQPLYTGILPVVILLCCELAVAFISMKNLKFRSIVSGTPSVVIRDGQINQPEMRKNRLTIDELTEELRAQGVTDISTIKYAILEITGSLSVIPYTAHSPATYSAHNLTGEDNGLPVLLINDGRILSENLKQVGRDENWLRQELSKRGVKNHKQVFLLSMDENQNIYFAAKT